MSHLPLPKERNLFLAKQVDQDSINAVAKDIIGINEDDSRLAVLYDAYGLKYVPKPIKLFIDSYGGHVYQCYGLIGVIQQSNAPVFTYVTGAAFSAAFLIAISGERRFAYPMATFMYHQISSTEAGKIGDIAISQEENIRLQAVLEKHVLANTGLTKKQLDANFKTKTDWYFNAEQALKYKIVGEVL